MTNTSLFIRTIASFAKIPEQELEAMPPEDLAKHILAYVNTLEPQKKEKVMEEFYRNMPCTQPATPKVEADPDFIKEYSQEIQMENGQYKIMKSIKIKKDIVLPKGIYQISPGGNITASDCQTTIQPGTKFLFSNNTHLNFQGGRLIAVGTEKEKIEFLPTRKLNSSGIHLANMIETVIENFIVSGLNYPSNAISINNSEVMIKKGEIKNNDCGGINVDGLSTIVIEDTNIQNNTSASYGGGIFINYSKKVVLKNTKIKKNISVYGGGGISTSSLLTIFENCEIESNHANNEGGGIRCTGKAELKSCKVLSNTAKQPGGGIYGSDVTLDDKCIIEGNSKPQVSGNVKYNPAILKD